MVPFLSFSLAPGAGKDDAVLVREPGMAPDSRLGFGSVVVDAVLHAVALAGNDDRL